MTLQNSWVALLFLGLAFSGCFASESSQETTSPEEPAPSAPEAESSNATPEASPVEAVLVVLIDRNETEAVNGTIGAVAGANLTFDGSGSAGADLTYSWDFGDGATGANATEVHTFAAAGLYNVTLTVASGNETSTAAVVIDVSAGGPQPGDLVWTDAKTFTGTLTIGNPNSANLPEYDHRDHVVAIVASTPDGTAAMAKRAVITLDGSGAAAVQMYLYWRSPSGTNLASATTASVDQKIDYAGDMPPGNYVVRVRLFAGAQASYTVKASIDYLAV